MPIRIVERFVEGYTSSGFSKWYAAILDCKHWHYSGGNGKPFTDIYIGSQVDCATCRKHDAAVERLKALDFSTISYFRFSNRWAYPEQGIMGQYHGYQRVTNYPTGVMLACSFPAIKEVEEIINKSKACTLSPTEGR